MRWDREKLPEPNLHVCGEDDTKIMVYNMRRWPRKGGSKNLEQERLRNTSLKEELWTLDQITQVMPMIIFISHTLNFSSKPPTTVTSFLKLS